MGDRKRLRLDGFDYSTPGAYFVTICCQNRECLLANPNEPTSLSAFGEAVKQTWLGLPDHYPNMSLDVFVVMPNHFHAVVNLEKADGKAAALPRIIQGFKAHAAQAINRLRNNPGLPVWQRGYHDRIIRDEFELTKIRIYIQDKPARWSEDAENPYRDDFDVLTSM